MFHIIFLVLRRKINQIYTRWSTASSTLAITAVAIVSVVSFLEDQRSIKPSDLLVLYFSATALTYIPLLRSLWLIPVGQALRALWALMNISSILLVLVESSQKADTLRPAYEYVTKEETTSLWNRASFAWVVRFLRVGYSEVIYLEGVPDVDISQPFTSITTVHFYNCP